MNISLFIFKVRNNLLRVFACDGTWRAVLQGNPQALGVNNKKADANA
jgi:hypothetical protein